MSTTRLRSREATVRRLAWLFAEVGVGDKDAMDRSISADLFVVDENGQNKIQYVEFEYGD